MIAVPPATMARTVAGIGQCSGAVVETFARFGLAARPARHGAAPLLPACLAKLECRVTDTRMAGAYCMFMREVAHAWVAPGWRSTATLHHQGRGRLVPDGRAIRLPSGKA